jgi:hypothetical protein
MAASATLKEIAMVADPSSLSKLVPGFDFLESLVKNAGSAIPGLGQWVAPTIDPAELDKRIQELRTVQYWLEQNARMLGATIQALEVQRMTLSTLQTMNVQMTDLRDALLVPAQPPAAAAKPPRAAPAPKPAAAAKPADEPAVAPEAAAEPAPPPVPAVDPMQWWGALTKQFTELASAAIKNGTAAAESAATQAAATVSSKPTARKATAKAPPAPVRKRNR